MARELTSVIDTPERDDLFAGLHPTAQIFGAKIADGSGQLKRGSVLVEDAGEYALLEADPEGAAVAVLADDIDTDDAPETVYNAYSAGNFFMQKLIAAEGVNLQDFVVNGQLYPGIFVNDGMARSA